MLSTLILAAILGQAPQAPGWYAIANHPGWEGWGSPSGDQLTPDKWRLASKPEEEWEVAWKKVQTKKPSPAIGLQKIVMPATVVTTPVVFAAPVEAGDPFGFTGWLNNLRAGRGLGPVAWDPVMANDAAINNQHQNGRGIGHHYMGNAHRQNAGWGASRPIWDDWTRSPGHMAALLDPSIRGVGLAVSGMYSTFSAR